ncbi:hypothetical protein JW935_25845 [candidate division KSB1 bacterium]|nr:hypothetical protein [candidate division KSB1 bacterium]
MILRIGLVCVILLSQVCWAQGFFDDEPSSAPSPAYDMNGFMRGVFFGGKVIGENDAELKSGYGELGLKMRVRKGRIGDGFAEIRFRRGSEFGNNISDVNIREAYVDAYIGNIDLRIGQQIVQWGRADGFNPTNNITPQDMLARSPDEDDRKLGNFLIRSSYYINPFEFEFIWVPQYAPSVLPVELFPFPSWVTLGPDELPDARLKNCLLAGKIGFRLGRVDGSLSYVKGYMPLPGINIGPDKEKLLGVIVMPKPYKMQVFGFDFSTTLGSFGLRGEAAYRHAAKADSVYIPFLKSEQFFLFDYMPNSDLQYVFGMDRSIGNFSLIVQYIGRYVFDFVELELTKTPIDQLGQTNRMIASQQFEISHSVFLRPALAMFHETVNWDMLAYYNITSEEYLVRTSLGKQLYDALVLKIGAEIYDGPDDTLFGSIHDALSSGFIELKLSF